MRTIIDRETWDILQEKLGRRLAMRVHQEDETHFAFDVIQVSCPEACDDHAIRIHLHCNLINFIKTVKQLEGAQIL